MIAVVLLFVTRHRFPFTTLAYILILIHYVVLMVGGHYTYAEVPLFDWIKDAFGMSRNNYDKLGHFVQGFVPAIVALFPGQTTHLQHGLFYRAIRHPGTPELAAGDRPSEGLSLQTVSSVASD